jgi:outer membrane protein OmpA-like peptidoglycan-associated protein
MLTVLLTAGGTASAIDCQPPAKPVKAWDSQVNKSIIWFGSGKGGDVRERVMGAANDIVRKQPEADRLYLQQAMLFSYCSALRDDPRISEGERASLQATYAAEVKKVFAEIPPLSVKRQRAPAIVDCRNRKAPDLVLPFRKNSYNVDDAALQKLNSFAKQIKKKKYEGVFLAGYAQTGKGADRDNELSLTRAAAVRYALLRSGIPELQMTIKGFGSAPSATADKNLPSDRVELCVSEEPPLP